MRVLFHTFGCKANQYDTERMRQETQARGGVVTKDVGLADVCVVNTCTVTNAADAEARRFIRRLKRENPLTQVVVAGCSAVLRTAEYAEMEGVVSVVPGHDPVHVAAAVGAAVAGPVERQGSLLQLGMDRGLDGSHLEPIGAAILDRREGATRGWLKIQDGCDRKCAFCATRLARGASRSRSVDGIITDVDAASLTQVETFTMRDNDNNILVFRIAPDADQEVDGGFVPSHLREHALTVGQVEVFYRVEDGESLALKIEHE